MRNDRLLVTAAVFSGLSLATLLALSPAVSAGDGPDSSDGGVVRGKDGAPYVIGKEVGKDIPDINLNWCLNDEGRGTVAEHRGEVVLVDLWATTCGPCKGLIPTFTKDQEEMGKKGLHIFGITGETPDVLGKWLATENTSDIGYNMASGSSGGLLSPGTVPYCFLIGVDGKVLWQGHGHPPGKMIDAEMKKVVPPTTEVLEARAAKTLERAEAFMTEKRVLQATKIFEKVSKDKAIAETETAKKAAERLAAIQADKDLAAELAAQTTVAKILGGVDFPKERLSKKDSISKQKQLDTLFKGDGAACTGAKAMADFWTTKMKSD